ncbi:YjjI family glycine radical enzyme [Oceanirhabdus seepicola]|uniref:YjjI family glycine radical enzyme n=1 Tax=Oceanirhabdus seepicola TaxID=2828781 RepID=A0A9J6NWP1_9CLOT|nr:YjjI family glycine radical enzyme [Oceanirhabdus seepicola]MCM1988422.1 YjjI family glycine radical enzyme [Oceanirhabdus seepicola]
MSDVLNIIKDKTLTFEQRVIALARAAENSIDVLGITEEIQKYRDNGVICDLGEGNAPYRPRYIVPDYNKFMEQGSEFLKLQPPTDIWEAVNNLLILYKHVPSITTFPVYIGNIDKLLDPFVNDEEEAYKAIKFFMLHIDRTITDSFCHANIGPEKTKAGEIILRVQRELEVPIPNITIKYDEEITPNDFAIDAINTALITAKPSFANHKMFTEDIENYGIASCYNGLKIGGGAYTLVRLNFGRLVDHAENKDHFMNELFPDAVEKMLQYIDMRINFLVEESGFFENHFLLKEGLINSENFTGMFGEVGIADCVNKLLKCDRLEDRFGHSEVATELGVEIIDKLNEMVNNHYNKHCKFTDGKFMLHAQVGIDTDNGIAPGCRIPIGEEPEIFDHLKVCAKFHKYFPSGIGDIFSFDTTVKKNPQYILDIIKGSFSIGVRYFSPYASDCDVVRITGYLVKRSEIEKIEKGEAVLRDTTVLGAGAVKNQRVLQRKERSK